MNLMITLKNLEEDVLQIQEMMWNMENRSGEEVQRKWSDLVERMKGVLEMAEKVQEEIYSSGIQLGWTNILEDNEKK